MVLRSHHSYLFFAIQRFFICRVSKDFCLQGQLFECSSLFLIKTFYTFQTKLFLVVLAHSKTLFIFVCPYVRIGNKNIPTTVLLQHIYFLDSCCKITTEEPLKLQLVGYIRKLQSTENISQALAITDEDQAIARDALDLPVFSEHAKL